MGLSQGFSKLAISMEAARKAFRSRVESNLRKMEHLHGDEYVRTWARPRAEESMSALPSLNGSKEYPYKRTQIREALKLWKKALGRRGQKNLGLPKTVRKESLP